MAGPSAPLSTPLPLRNFNVILVATRKDIYRVAQKTGPLCYIASNFRNTA